MKKAVLVGINYENNPNARLYGCINDINRIGDVLTDAFGYKLENITKLRDDALQPSFLPTRSNILTSLTKLVRESANCDEIWFHYSGHGSQIRDRNGDEADGLDEVIVPLDYTSNGVITDDDIFNILRASRCKTVLLFDSCNSGTVCDLQWRFDYVNNRQVKILNTSLRVLANPNIFCFSGARDTQTAADTYSNEQRQSVGAFTSAFIYCLRQNNMNVDAVRLHTDICAYIQTTGFSQVPTLSSSSANPVYTFKRAGTTGSPARTMIPITNSAISNKFINMNMNVNMNMNMKNMFSRSPAPSPIKNANIRNYKPSYSFDLQSRFIYQ
jgi:hypothetical protein